MQHAMIKLVDTILLIIAALVIIIAGLAGMKAGPLQAILMAAAAFVGSAFTCGFWFCVSGIYHHTKALAEKK
ncbi:hypothetical protein D3C81_365240 [compost metagenome]